MVQTLQVQSSMPSSATSSVSGFPGLSRRSTGQSSDQGITDMRYVDLSFITTMCDEVAELGRILRSQTRYLLDPTGSPCAEEAQPEPTKEDSGAAVSTGHARVHDESTGTEQDVASSTVSEDDVMAEAIVNPADFDWNYFDYMMEHDLGYSGSFPGEYGGEPGHSSPRGR